MLYSQFGKQDKDATHCEALESGRMGREWLVMSGIGGGGGGGGLSSNIDISIFIFLLDLQS